jgi:DNA processing protein
MNKEAAYWIALAHLPKWGYAKINSLIISFFHDHKIPIDEFFQLSEKDWKEQYKLDENQILDLRNAKNDLPKTTFLAESFLSQGYEIIPITSAEYSKTLKKNLKATYSPSVLYVKGNKKLMQERSIAIVGSRSASQVALDFTDNVAKQACQDYKVVVSGFAKGVDKQALDSALNYKGQSIIVLPQGIMTFSSGFKTYYQQILAGDVLVLSTFFPKAPWKTELAMARNPIIYGLAEEIYVAESAEKGGTWSGVIDGLKKGRKIFVRQPEVKEAVANSILIAKGATPVDMQGKETSPAYVSVQEEPVVMQEPEQTYNLDARIQAVFNGKPLSAKDVLAKLSLDWTTQKLNLYLKKLDFLEVVKEKSKTLYKIKNVVTTTQKKLFE